MARIGMQYLCFAPITAEANNSITYGTGLKADHARRGAVTYNWDEASLYGDDALAEYLKTMTGADVEIETTELANNVATLLGLETVKSGTGATTVYTLATECTTNVGFGFIQVNVVNGTKIYRAIWFHKVTFSPSNEESSTKEETIAWGTPTITGKVWPVHLDASGVPQVRDYQEFSTLSAAETWLKTKAGIT